jgi:hypothetical protein
MNSPKKINYETRPFKFTERKMLLSTFIRLCNKYEDFYQYIGFGGLSFTDFKLFHKELHISNMHSIEGGDFSIDRLSFNNPYSFIKIYKEFSTSALTKIDLSKKSIIWLDYDGDLDNYMFEDLSILMNKLPIGSIYLMTCNKQLKSEKTGEIYQVEEFKEKFGSKVPFDIKSKNFSGEENHKTIRKMLLIHIENIIKGRNRNNENIKFQQLYNIIYQENRGAKMFTFGGIITEKETEFSTLNLSDLLFIRTDDNIYRIEVPNITFKEEVYINQHVGNDQKIDELKGKNIIDENDIDKYIAIYKFLPNFFDVRI